MMQKYNIDNRKIDCGVFVMTTSSKNYIERKIKGKYEKGPRFKILVKQYDELSQLISGQQTFSLFPDEALRFQDILNLLDERGYIGCAKMTHISVYQVKGPLTDFREWLSRQERDVEKAPTYKQFVANMEAKLVDPEFIGDTEILLRSDADKFDATLAYDLVKNTFIDRMPGKRD